MTNKETEIEIAPPPQVYLIMDPSLSDEPLKELEHAVQAVNSSESAPISSLLIKNNDENSILNAEFITKIQAHNIAVIIEDNVPLAKSLGADGVHLSNDDETIFEATLETLSEEYIIGATAKQSRHKAMVFAESGCSYMAINLFEQNENERDLEDFERPPEINWWVSLFSTPCVAWEISSIEQANRATIEGADFIALAPSYWQKGNETASAIETLVKSINAIERTVPSL